MNNQNLEQFLSVVDSRVKKYVSEDKILRQYCGKVVGEVLDDNNIPTVSKYKVVLVGNDDTEFVFLNKTGEILQVNDRVYIQTVGTDLNTGVITYKSKESNLPDCVIETGTETNGWTYRKWSSGYYEAWFNKPTQEYLFDQEYYQNLYKTEEILLPTNFIDILNFNIVPISGRGLMSTSIYTINIADKKLGYYLWPHIPPTVSQTSPMSLSIKFYLQGKWKAIG